jgi:hypothetical protein
VGADAAGDDVRRAWRASSVPDFFGEGEGRRCNGAKRRERERGREAAATTGGGRAGVLAEYACGGCMRPHLSAPFFSERGILGGEQGPDEN